VPNSVGAITEDLGGGIQLTVGLANNSFCIEFGAAVVIKYRLWLSNDWFLF